MFRRSPAQDLAMQAKRVIKRIKSGSGDTRRFLTTNRGGEVSGEVGKEGEGEGGANLAKRIEILGVQNDRLCIKLSSLVPPSGVGTRSDHQMSRIKRQVECCQALPAAEKLGVLREAKQDVDSLVMTRRDSLTKVHSADSETIRRTVSQAYRESITESATISREMGVHLLKSNPDEALQHLQEAADMKLNLISEIVAPEGNEQAQSALISSDRSRHSVSSSDSKVAMAADPAFRRGAKEQENMSLHRPELPDRFRPSWDAVIGMLHQVSDPKILLRSHLLRQTMEEAKGAARKGRRDIGAADGQYSDFITKSFEEQTDLAEYIASACLHKKDYHGCAQKLLGVLRDRILVGNTIGVESTLSNMHALLKICKEYNEGQLARDVMRWVFEILVRARARKSAAERTASDEAHLIKIIPTSAPARSALEALMNTQQSFQLEENRLEEISLSSADRAWTREVIIQEMLNSAVQNTPWILEWGCLCICAEFSAQHANASCMRIARSGSSQCLEISARAAAYHAVLHALQPSHCPRVLREGCAAIRGILEDDVRDINFELLQRSGTVIIQVLKASDSNTDIQACCLETLAAILSVAERRQQDEAQARAGANAENHFLVMDDAFPLDVFGKGDKPVLYIIRVILGRFHQHKCDEDTDKSNTGRVELTLFHHLVRALDRSEGAAVERVQSTVAYMITLNGVGETEDSIKTIEFHHSLAPCGEECWKICRNWIKDLEAKDNERASRVRETFRNREDCIYKFEEQLAFAYRLLSSANVSAEDLKKAVEASEGAKGTLNYLLTTHNIQYSQRLKAKSKDLACSIKTKIQEAATMALNSVEGFLETENVEGAFSELVKAKEYIDCSPTTIDRAIQKKTKQLEDKVKIVKKKEENIAHNAQSNRKLQEDLEAMKSFMSQARTYLDERNCREAYQNYQEAFRQLKSCTANMAIPRREREALRQELDELKASVLARQEQYFKESERRFREVESKLQRGECREAELELEEAWTELSKTNLIISEDADCNPKVKEADVSNLRKRREQLDRMRSKVEQNQSCRDSIGQCLNKIPQALETEDHTSVAGLFKLQQRVKTWRREAQSHLKKMHDTAPSFADTQDVVKRAMEGSDEAIRASYHKFREEAIKLGKDKFRQSRNSLNEQYIFEWCHREMAKAREYLIEAQEQHQIFCALSSFLQDECIQDECTDAQLLEEDSKRLAENGSRRPSWKSLECWTRALKILEDDITREEQKALPKHR